MPVLLPNGTVARIEYFPLVDWAPLFMASVAGAQALEVDISNTTELVAHLEHESSGVTTRLIAMMEEQGKEWQAAAQLQLVAQVAASEADVVLAKVEAARERLQHRRRAAAAAEAARNVTRAAEARSVRAVAARRAQLQLEVAAAAASDARAADARMEAARRGAERAALAAAARADAAAARAAADVRRAAAAAHASESAAAARANEGIGLARVAAQGAGGPRARAHAIVMELIGAADRERARAVVAELFALAARAAAALLENPAVAARAALLALALMAAALAARAAARGAAEAAERHFAKPALVRETSRSGSLAAEALSWVVPGVVAAAWRRRRQRRRRAAAALGDGGGGSGGIEGVVVNAALEERLAGVVEGVRGARERGAPLRHVLLHGPPGTGKTLIARRLAQLCGLDFAIMSGGDLAPLGNVAVSALHRLLDWARNCPRGMVLVIDEAEACAGDRRLRRLRMGEAALNCLNTLLYHTSEPSARFMLVLTTSRPSDLEEAILDRVDDMIELPLPERAQRRRMCDMFYNTYIARHSIQQRSTQRGSLLQRLWAPSQAPWALLGAIAAALNTARLAAADGPRPRLGANAAALNTARLAAAEALGAIAAALGAALCAAAERLHNCLWAPLQGLIDTSAMAYGAAAADDLARRSSALFSIRTAGAHQHGRDGLIDTSAVAYDAAAADDLARRSAGLSGRDIAKLVLAAQAAAYGSDACALTPPLWRAVVDWKLREYARTQRGSLYASAAAAAATAAARAAPSGGEGGGGGRRGGGGGAPPEVTRLAEVGASDESTPEETRGS
ncbi:hypothetical protein JKP88DRAFT_352483 [Tribonema minus]|uniref:AAA+ ATPase domain-containing protein n=1 Tax=Tribonema minus TaxID=303371 RepID=A0A836CML0_9STRA|nr:hypothetical protein JKP88DRAFT_352483 [Tribonema minus]